MSEQEEKLTAIIPDFFAELIGRIAPGFAVIALSLYWSGSDFKAVFSTVGLSVFVLAAAWIIGVTLDVGVFCIGNMLRLDKLLKPFPKDDYYIHWQYLLDASEWERGIINKQRSQLIFFRNMMSVCGLTVLACIIMEFSSRLDSLLPVLHNHHRCYGILAIVFFIVFMLCWRATRECLRLDWAKLFKELSDRKNRPGHT